MSRRFVVLSGLPCSGKSTLARRLAPALQLPVIDKDCILEELYESRGVGDALWRRRLSRESDVLFQAEAQTSAGAILVSFWHVPGMSPDSGTPTGWLAALSSRVVEVHCACAPEIAAERFVQRARHPGHLDKSSSYEEILRSLQAIPRCGALEIGTRVDVDTSSELNLDVAIEQLHFLLKDPII